MSARQDLSDDVRTNRVLYRIRRERVLTRAQIAHVNGTNELVARMVELGWLERVDDGEPAGAPRERFALTAAGERGSNERFDSGNYATC